MSLEGSGQIRKGFWKSGSWVRDEYARYVLFRGVNFASRSKLPPYLPIAPLGATELSQVDLKEGDRIGETTIGSNE